MNGIYSCAVIKGPCGICEADYLIRDLKEKKQCYGEEGLNYNAHFSKDTKCQCTQKRKTESYLNLSLGQALIPINGPY